VPVDTAELLRRAAGLVPADARSHAEHTVADALEYLRYNEWEVALGLLLDFPDSSWESIEFWDLLEQAAQQMRLDREGAWCRWRRTEIRSGVIRAELELAAPAAGGRHTPVPGPGVLRPMWDLGRPRPDSPTGWQVAAIWVEHAPELQPGTTGPVRLLPGSPVEWRHLKPGDLITMHESQARVGIAMLTETTPPISV
jgi:hypothetical protein